MALGMSKEEGIEFVNSIINDVTKDNSYDMTYLIHVEYTTGDSFNTYETEETIEYPWHDFRIVSENLHRLEEQNRYYEMLHSYSCDKTRDEILTEWAHQPWAVSSIKINEDPDRWMETTENRKIGVNTFSVFLLKDDGTEFQMSTSSWTGYFESVHGFSIKQINNKFN